MEKEKKMPAFTLASVLPQPSTVMLQKKEYVMRVFNTNDMVYFEQKYGSGYFMQYYATKPSEVLSEIAYRLITFDQDGGKLPGPADDFPTLEAFRRITPQEFGKQNVLGKALLARGEALKPTAREAQPKGEGFRGRKAARVG